MIVKNKVTDEEIKQMVVLDKENFTSSDSGTFEICKKWYLKNNEIYTVLLDKDKVVGYINFVPIRSEIYLAMKNGFVKDMDLDENDILPYEENKEYNCLCMSICIQKEYRHGKAIILLTNSLNKKLANICKEKNIKIKSVLADCVSTDGENLIKHLGFEKVANSNHNSILYEKIY